MRIILPIRTRSEANQREHWAPKAKRVKEQRGLAKALTCSAYIAADTLMPGRVPGSVLRGKGVLAKVARITLTRIASRKLDDGNLGASFKAVQDGIADALGIDDGDPRLTWVYRQERGDPKECKVGVTIEADEEA